MDDGQVIPRLNEDWTFFGAKPMEWASGLIFAMLFVELFLPKNNWGRYMPLIIIVLVGFPITLARLRQIYPDQERGLRNHVMSILGFTPVDIPPPAKLQPVWSGAPYQELEDVKKDCKYLQLQLDKVFVNESRFSEAEKYYY